MATANLPLALAENWGEIAAGALTQLERMKPAVPVQFATRAWSGLLEATAFFAIVLMMMSVAVLFVPMLGIPMLALLPAVLLARKRRHAGAAERDRAVPGSEG